MYIRDKVLKKQKMFQDTSSLFRKVNQCLYQGFVPNSVLNVDNVEIGYLDGLHEYTVYPHGNKNGIDRKRKSLNIVPISARYLTKLILGEGYEMTINNDSESKKLKWFKELLDYNNWDELEKDNIEVFCALGDKVNSFYRNGSNIEFNYVTADRYEVVEYTNSKITGIVYFTERLKEEKGKQVYYYLLEYHTVKQVEVEGIQQNNYIIRREIYKGKERNTLEEYCNWDSFKALFDSSLEEEELFEGLDVPMFTFTKTPIKNTKDLYSKRGIGLPTNAYDNIASMDKTYDSNDNEIEYTRFQIAVPDEMLDEYEMNNGEKKEIYNTHKSMYTGLGRFGEYQFEPKIINPTIRQEPYTQKINLDLDIYAFNTGFTSGSFRFDGKSIATATQVRTENALSHLTRVEFGDAIRKKWRDFLYNVSVYAKYWGLIDWELTKEDIVIKFDDSIVQDENVIYERDKEMVSLGIMPKEVFAIKYNDIDETKYQEWVAKVNEEKQRENESALSFFGDVVNDTEDNDDNEDE